MIYVPILKTRTEELRIMLSVKGCLGERIIPLIEIISEKYATRYMVDDRGEFVCRIVNGRKMKIKCKPTEQDIITLEYVNELVNHNKVFIDYFRFSLDKYGKNIDFDNAELAYNLSNDYELYKKKIFSIPKYENMIPVISIKKGFEISKRDLKKILSELQNESMQVALRITEEWLDDYQDIMEDMLRKEDYLLFDIEEQDPETKFMEIEQLKDYGCSCNIILLNSPRKAIIKNGEYPERGITDLINNCAKDIAETYELDGYGDYCGLKDVMPTKNGSNGTGAALALLYDFKDNVFYSYCNHDTSLGVKGYRALLPVIKEEEVVHNKDGDCLGYERINKLPGCGNWNVWHHINAVRYIHQVYKNI